MMKNITSSSGPVAALASSATIGWRLVWISLLFLVTVTAHAAAPVMTLPAAVTVLEDGSTNLSFSVSDADSSLFNVTITAKSSDTTLVPNTGLAVSGGSGSRFLGITPALHKYGTATITLIATDENLESSTNTLTLNVTFTNYPPTFTVAATDRTIREDAGSTNISFTIADVETAVSGLTATATSTNTTLLPNGNLVLSGTNAARTLNLTTVTNLSGTTLVQLIITDGGSAKATNNFILTVLPVNDAPTFAISTNQIAQLEDAGLTTVSNFLTAISAGPSNESTQTTTLTLEYTTNFFATGPTVDGSGTLSFQVATNANGTNTIRFIVADDGGTANGGKDRTTNSLTLAVASVNDLPFFTTNISNLTINEDSGRTNLAFSIFDADHAVSTLTVTATSTNAALVGVSNFLFTGTSSNRTVGISTLTNAFGTTEISLIVSDPAGGKATNTFLLTVNSVADAPILSGTTNRTVLENSTTNLTAVISLYDADTAITNVAVSVSSSDTNLVTASFSSTNVVATNILTLGLDFGLKTNANGAATITIIANDGGVSTTNSFLFTVTPVNDQPTYTFSTNLVLVAEDAGFVTNVAFLTGISPGPTNEASQTWTFTVTSGTNFGYVLAPSISTNGTLAFKTATNAFGTNTITVVMKDSGGTANGGKDAITNTFTLGVTPVNDAPTFTGVAAKSILEDATTNKTMVVNVIDVDTIVTNLVVFASSSDTNIATVAISSISVLNNTNAALTLTFTPVTNVNGSVAITLGAFDGALGLTNSFLLTVTAVNDAPSFALSTNLVLAAEDAGFVTNASFLTTLSAGPTNEASQTWTFTVTSGTNFGYDLAPSISTNGTLVFKTATNAFGTNTLTVVMKDSGGTGNGGIDSVTNTFTLGITPVNDAPNFSGVAAKTILEDATTNKTMVINLVDTDTAASNLSATVSSSDTNLVDVVITATNIVNGTNVALTLTFTPVTNVFGSAVITLTGTDGALSKTNTFLLTVTPVNDQPGFALSTNLVLVAEDAGFITNANFLTGISTGPTNESDQTWSFTVTSSTNFGYAFAPAITTNGTFIFKTATNAVGTNTLTVVLKDSGGTANGGKDSITNTFTLVATPVNDAPTFTGVAAKSILEDGTTNNTLVVNLTDVDTANTSLSATVVSSDTNLVTVAITTTNAIGTATNGYTLTFTPVTNQNGSATITLVGTDGALSTTNSFLLTVTPVNDQPSFALSTNLVLVAEDAGFITNASFLTALSAGPTNEVSQTWSFTVTSGTNFGYVLAPSITTNGTLAFKTATNAVGTNTITIVMKDSGGTSNNGRDSVTNTFSLAVTPVNDAPSFTGVAAKTILEDGTTNNTMVVSLIDSDTVNTSLSTTVVSSDTNLVAVAITATNAIGTATNAYTLTFTTGTNENGTATITLVGTDGALSTTNSFLLTVTPVNDQPSFALSTNLVLVAEDAGFITNASFLTTLSAGPTNEVSQTWSFTVTSGTNFGYVLAPSITTNGTLAFKTATNAVGTNTITIVMKDSGGTSNNGRDSVTNTFAIGVTPVNDAPTFAGVVAKTILEDATTNKTMVVNLIDTDSASTNMSAAVSSSDTNIATVVITGTNVVSSTNTALTLTFTPLTNINGSVVITLVGTDGSLNVTNSFLLTVTAVNDQPSFTLSTNLVLATEDVGFVTNANFLTALSAGPTNEVSQTWSFTVTSGTNFGYVLAPAITTNGTLVFKTATNAVGTNTITVVMKDSGGTANGGADSVTNTFSLGVTPANDAPTFVGIAAKTILEDATTNKTMVVTLTDSDSINTNLSATVTSSDTNLVTVAVTATNAIGLYTNALTLTFTPATNANGSAVITLVGTDGSLSTTNSFLLTVTAVNDQPSFALSTNLVLVAEDAGNITNASFLTSIATGPTNETSQTWSFTVTSGTNFGYVLPPAITTNGTLVFKTATNAVGTNTITVVMKDSGGTANGGSDSITNTFTLGVTPVNDAPTFYGVAAKTILEDGTTNLTMLVSIADTDTINTNLSATVVSSDTNLVTVAITTTNAIGTATNGYTLTFTPVTNQNGSATITLVGTDGALSTTNSFLLTVTPVNDQPSFALSTNLVLVAEDAGFITNASFLTALSAGPTNEVSQTWSFTVTSGTNFGYVLAPSITTNGTLAFKTATNAVGTNTITIVMKDSGGTSNNGRDSVTNTFSLAVTPVNDAPSFTGVAAKTILEDGTTNLTVVINVIDTDTINTNFNLTATSSDTNLVTVAISATNAIGTATNAYTLTFAPATNQNGAATITLIATDGSLSTTNSFLLTVTPVNDQPSFALSTNLVLVAEDAGFITNASFLTALSAGPTNEDTQTWTFTVTSGTNFGYVLAPSITTNGTLAFKTATNAVGTNTITIVMKDSGGTSNNGRDSVTNTFSLAVTPVNDAPSFTGVAAKTILEDGTTNLTAVINVIDTDTINTNFNLTATSSDTNLVTVAISATNAVGTATNAYTLTFAPTTNQNGSATITLIATDGALSTTNSFLLTVTPVNDQPSFALSTNLVLVAEDAGFITNASFLTALSAGPTNEDTQTWTFTVTSGTNFGYVLAPSISTNGTLAFKTATNAVGTNTITIVMKDSGGTSNNGRDSVTNTFSLAVTPVNDAPSFTGVAAKTILEDGTTNLTAVINVIDTDTINTNFNLTATSSDTNLVTVAISATNAVGTATNAYTLTFAPTTNQNGSATITLIATDGALSTTNSFLLTVTPVNDQPSFALSTNLVLVAEDAGFITNASFLTALSAGPTNEDTQTWTFTVTSGTNFGYVLAPSITTNGTLAFKTATNAYGTNVITVVMKDSGGTANNGRDSVTNTFSLAVTPVNDAPSFYGAADKTILEDSTTNNTMAVALFDVDNANTNISATVSTSDTNLATVAITATNAIGTSSNSLTLTFTPKTNANGSATITLIGTDGTLSTTNTFVLTVTPVNDAPSYTLSVTNLAVDKYNVAVSVPDAVTNILAGPTNEASQIVSFIVSNSNNGLFTSQPVIGTNGTLTFTPAAKGGTAVVTVWAKDNAGKTNGGEDTSTNRTFTITAPGNAFTALQGSYAGLFFDTNALANDSSGYFRIALATNGTFSGHLLRAGGSNTFSGQFSAATSTASVIVTNASCVLNLTLDTTTNWSESISGSVSNTVAGWQADLLAYLNVYAGGFPASLDGNYLVAVPGNASAAAGPSGASTLSLIVSNNGGVSLTGYLADDTSVRQNTQLSRNGNIPLYFGLGATGSASGWITVKAGGTSQLTTDSEVVWIRGAGTSTYYPAGFTNATVAVGSLYNSNAVNLLTMSSGSVVLSGGGLASPITNAFTLANNVFTIDPAVTNGLTLSIFAPDGQVTGTFTANGQTYDINSVILQSTNQARGYFVRPTGVGSVLIH